MANELNVKDGIKVTESSSVPTSPTSGSRTLYATTAGIFDLDSSGNYSQLLGNKTYGSAKNLLLNSSFAIWQRSNAANTVTNGNSTYQPDRWFIKNGLGTNGVITFTRTTAVTDGIANGASIKITTAPTASQANGCEFYQTVENPVSILAYNKPVSFSCKIKALGNVTSVTMSILYLNSSGKVTFASATGNTTTNVTVNTSTFVTGSIENYTIPSGMTTSGVIGVGFKINAVSSGNTYDLNNGYIIEVPMLNVGTTASSYFPAHPQFAEEVRSCQRFYEKSYDLGTDPGTASTNGAHLYFASLGLGNTPITPCIMKVTKRTTPTVEIYSTSSGTAARVRNETGAADKAASGQRINTQNFLMGGTGAGTAVDGDALSWHWTADAEI